ncbi:hypothetical protein BDD43_6054 [Mucilaginibacter gracilis]|uniref:Uncharacterized protein n=1 Tax=Mucilaginibacter gracilis TaxID=423350 RepID=A0A495JBA3_9SPHI|nr:hypothetical protein [Mucilaginibacter gracilis]RKR85778.1 hypothetical protein BDD43_6054 [Mucilaginibacter gracilis]
MEKELERGVPQSNVSHNGSTDDLLNQINDRLGPAFKVAGFG